ncbi:PREDICTED: glycerol kinase-like isoform X2 [Nicrophorus vespilloides]|nr:PREDICTED: glycerol kinase-like isoform X2 [Nicrophorus vespilloides]XP_017785875.1 PREDICTED: glycerol kinase-like isoform X2 [Nicrophorus vespilloides]XP_017785876.1 PREDICTED: glycerol kinase-like isoform X2 [Nicrophorus vespilloides]XP_017785877.1 PREDICTED: glycerol kinase-like isoform X2 [Nicrophorus vespilloides]
MSEGKGDSEPLIGVIDAGTRTIKFCVFRAKHTKELAEHAVDINPIVPEEGWHEQDPKEILDAINTCIQNVTKSCNISDIVTIGVTNQRETTVVWDKTTGEPLHNAIVWNDIRTSSTVDQILAKLPDNNKNHFKQICGLPVSPYFSAFKLKWLMDNVKNIRRAIKKGTCLFGTIDTWIVWNLTGGVNGGIHITDVTNASRTFLMNIETLHWDPLLLHTFNVNAAILPEIRNSSEVYGKVKGTVLDGIPISGILGNQQSALVGQNCFKEGQAKNTYRSGCFLLYNTGKTRVQSTHGLVTTVAYKFGDDKPTYALEGSVAIAGEALNWLRDNMGLIKNVQEDTESLAQEVFNTGDVYFVPAFKGLYAPYWRKDARGIICGLTAYTTKKHIIRAALEAVCFQTRDILEAMNKDCGIPLSKLHVDGKLTTNNLLMQLQADISGIPVFRSQSQDMTALGVAMAAGQAKGIDVWDLSAKDREIVPSDTFLPTTTEDERNARYNKWKMAVHRSLGWALGKKSAAMTDERYRLLSSVPAGLFLIGSFGMLVLSAYV